MHRDNCSAGEAFFCPWNSFDCIDLPGAHDKEIGRKKKVSYGECGLIHNVIDMDYFSVKLDQRYRINSLSEKIMTLKILRKVYFNINLILSSFTKM